MLNVYAVVWCPHCQETVDFAKENRIEFNYVDLEKHFPSNLIFYHILQGFQGK